VRSRRPLGVRSWFDRKEVMAGWYA
jgi:hypothetical protein